MKKLVRLSPILLFLTLQATGQDMLKLYMHVDRTIYKPGETIWFTAYTLNRDEEIMKKQHVLYAVLVDTAHKNAAAKKRFQVTYGLVRGDLQIPDTMRNGHYWLVAYTDDVYRLSQPAFRQQIIVNNRPIGFISSDYQVSTPGLKMTIDSAIRKPGEPVSVSMQVTDSSGAQIRGMFSISVAAAGKVAARDISHYHVDTSVLLRNPGKHIDPDYGYVLYKGKQPKEAVNLAIISGGVIKFKTNPSGSFELPFQLLKGGAGGSLMLSVTEDKTEDYIITLRHSTDSIDSVLTHLNYSDTLPAGILADTNARGLVASSGTMQAAVVKAKFNDDEPNTSGDCNKDIVYNLHGERGTGPQWGVGGSGKILNWRAPERHEYGTEKPVEGMSYLYFGRDPRFTPNGDGSWVYHCAAPERPKFLVPLDIVAEPRAFVPEPGFDRSTIYWAPLLTTDKRGEARVSFVAGAVPGKFVCTLEGISESGPIYGQIFFSVVE